MRYYFYFVSQKAPGKMTHQIENCSPEDFQQILTDIVDFWGSDRTLSLHHPMFVHEFRDTSFVIRHNDKVIAYLFGFLSQTSKTGYIHLVGVRAEVQRKGMGKLLYDHFIDHLEEVGYNRLKAITGVGNKKSISFHRKLGMHLLGEKNSEGIEVVKNYSGPGEDRVVFEMDI
jgi:L-amino acid N-acyltransferase YncA